MGSPWQMIWVSARVKSMLHAIRMLRCTHDASASRKQCVCLCMVSPRGKAGANPCINGVLDEQRMMSLTQLRLSSAVSACHQVMAADMPHADTMSEAALG